MVRSGMKKIPRNCCNLYSKFCASTIRSSARSAVLGFNRTAIPRTPTLDRDACADGWHAKHVCGHLKLEATIKRDLAGSRSAPETWIGCAVGPTAFEKIAGSWRSAQPAHSPAVTPSLSATASTAAPSGEGSGSRSALPAGTYRDGREKSPRTAHHPNLLRPLRQ